MRPSSFYEQIELLPQGLKGKHPYPFLDVA